MLGMAVGVLWFLIGLVILCGVIYLAIYVIENFVMAIPEKVKQAIWLIVLLLAIIALLTVLMTGSIGNFRLH
jgi:hypothetical protein